MLILHSTALTRQLQQHAARALDAALRQLPPVTGPTGALIPDPRLASWAEMCDVGRGFLTAAPSDSFAPTGREYQEHGRLLPGRRLSARV